MRLTKRGETVVMLLLGIALTLFLLACLAIGQARVSDLIEDSGLIEPTSITCTEDMPCWDCDSMGNGRCGP